MSEDGRALNTVIGLAVAGVSVTGVVSLLAALFLLLSGESVGAGLCFIGAALTFGFLANAVLGG
jgi:hypothetical protein